MTYARADVYSESESGFFHCITRCVRRSFLCGRDRYSGKSYEHRKSWIKSRLKELLEIFAIDCLAYSVMSNHLHSLLRTMPQLCLDWPAAEVARRWRMLFPRRRQANGLPEEPSPEEILEIVSNPELLATYRRRLGSLSWFHRCLNESIARRANAEDDCSGRFWEGRFKSIRLETPQSVLACSVYVDLNPIRAGQARTLEESDYTSLQDRILELVTPGAASGGPRLIQHSDVTFEEMSPEGYIKLVEETGLAVVGSKHSLSPETVSTLGRLGFRQEGWIKNAQSQSRLFKRVMAPVPLLRAYALKKQKAWLHGIKAASVLFG